MNAGAPVEARSLWRHRDFLLLWAAYSISLVGSAITELALPLVAVITLHARPFQVGLLTAAGLVPGLALSLIAGVLIERRSRLQPIMIAADWGRAFLLVTIPIAAAFDALRIAQLYAVALLAGTLTTIYRIAHSSFYPTLVERDQLVDENSKLQSSLAAASVGGPGIGGVLVQAFKAPYAIVVDAVSFVLSAFLLARIRHPEERGVEPGERKRIRLEIAEGLRYVMGRPVQRAIAASAAHINVFSYIWYVVFVVYAIRQRGLSPGALGVIFLVGGCGALLGAILAPRVGGQIGQGRTMIAGSVLVGLSLLAVPAIQGPKLTATVLYAAAEFVGSFGIGIYDVHGVALQQALAPRRLLARVRATSEFITQGAKPVGGFLGGVLGQTTGLRPALWVAGGGALLMVLWPWFSPLRHAELPGEEPAT